MVERCPRCSSGNIVGFKNSYECFNCGYAWKRSSLGRSVTIKEFFIPSWVMLLIALILVVAVAVPVSWRLLAQGTIMIKAAPKGSITVETIDPPGGDFGNIVLNPGEGKTIDVIFRINVTGRAYAIEGIYLGYNPYPPYKYFSPQECYYGNSLTNMTRNCGNYIGGGGGYREGDWVYQRYYFNFPGLEPGTYYLKLTFSMEPSYPDQDVSFSFKMYINFTEIR